MPKSLNLLRKWWLVAPALAVAMPAWAADTIRLTTQQQLASGIETGSVEARRTGSLQGLPAQVVVPNSQLHVVSTPLAGLVERIMVAIGTVARIRVFPGAMGSMPCRRPRRPSGSIFGARETGRAPRW